MHREEIFVAAVDGGRGRGKQRLYAPEQVEECRSVLAGRALPRAADLPIPTPTPVAAKAKAAENFAKISATDAQIGFKALHEGKKLTAIVVEDGLHPDVVIALTHAWAKLTGGIFISGEMLQQISLLTLDGPLPIASEQDLYDVLVIASDDQTCTLCNKQKRALCKKCVSTALAQTRQEERERFSSSPSLDEEGTERNASDALPHGESLHATISPG
jgi:hypothetical protein